MLESQFPCSLLLLPLVLCQNPPSITGIPNPYYVREHTNFRLDCSRYTQSQQPVTNFTWSGFNGYTSTGPVLSINNINREWSGQYTCSATVRMTATSVTGSASVEVDVQFEPRVNIPEVTTVTASSSLQINCNDYTASGNPSPTSYRWSSPDGYRSNGPVLSIPNISRDSSREYTCTATNTLTLTGRPPITGSSSDTTRVDIQYGPGNSISTSPGPTVERKEGSGSLNVTCSAICNPPCEFTWRKGASETQSHELYIPDVRKSDQGNYTCEARNRIGVSRKLFTLIVDDVNNEPQSTPIGLIGAIFGSIIGVLVIVGTIIFCMKGYRCTRASTTGRDESPTENSYCGLEAATSHHYRGLDNYEIPRGTTDTTVPKQVYQRTPNMSPMSNEDHTYISII